MSNVNGGGDARDDNGFISRLRPDGTVESLHWIMGGVGGVRLDAPKGLALHGDTLWTTDIDTIRGFDRRSGKALASVGIPTAIFLDGIVVAGDGSIYVTDAALKFDATGAPHRVGTGRVFRIGKGRAVTVAIDRAELATPTGIAWDARTSEIVVAPLNGRSISRWNPKTGDFHAMSPGPGDYDGLTALPDGRLLAASQQGLLLALDGGEQSSILRGVPVMGDVGVDARRWRALVPALENDRVEIWALPESLKSHGGRVPPMSLRLYLPLGAPCRDAFDRLVPVGQLCDEPL